MRAHFGIALSPYIDESIERAPQAAAHFTAFVQAMGYPNRLETCAVMMLEHTRHQNTDRVRAQIGREIGDANPIVVIDLAAPQRAAWWIFVPHQNLGTVQFVRHR